MSLFATLEKNRLLRPFDCAFAHCLQRLDPDTPDAVLLGAALASFAQGQGHVGLRLDAAAQLLERGSAVPVPDAERWQRQLAASRWVATPDDPQQATDGRFPLVLERGLLSLRRYREYERQLAADLARIGSAQFNSPAPSVAAQALFSRLFPHAASTDAHQATAAALAQTTALLLLTGGPGTGKTTTIARLLLLRIARAYHAAQPLPRIRLAAPTGKAAERMAASLRASAQQFAAMGIDPALCAQLPGHSETIHRLLGVIAGSPRFRHHAGNPLPADVVVIDEASMLDLSLMGKLAQAIADGCQLILIGDPDQLPSVDAGDVLGALVRSVGGEATDAATPPRFPARRVHLQRNYRQHGALNLAPLAEAVRASADPAQRARALELLRAGGLSNVFFHPDVTDPLEAAAAPLLAHWRALLDAATPTRALAGINAVRILTAVHDGPQGARLINARIAAMLNATAPRGVRRHFHGQPLIISENDHRQGLFNGDVGICLRAAGAPHGPLLAWFPGDTPDAPRAFHPAALPAHETAFAMTVHKAQGSEFERVWLLLPGKLNRSLTRELIYTAITRARTELHVLSRTDSLNAALAGGVTRWSNLAWHLGLHCCA